MWLHTTIGFFSVVTHRDDPRTIVIRARAREDLETLRRQHLPDLEIVADPTGRYACCALVSRDEWEHAAQQLAQNVDYADDEAMQRLQSTASGKSSRSGATDSEHHFG